MRSRQGKKMFSSSHECQTSHPRHLNLIRKALERAFFAGLTWTPSISLDLMLRGLTAMKRKQTQLEMPARDRGGRWRQGMNH
jgi:hypothetical protein